MSVSGESVPCSCIKFTGDIRMTACFAVFSMRLGVAVNFTFRELWQHATNHVFLS